MKKLRLALLVVIGTVTLITVYAWNDFYRIPLNKMTVYATSTNYHWLVRSLATYRLKDVAACPAEQFMPSTPLSFLIAAMDSADTDIERAKELFRHYLNVGCDINAMNREIGLRPIHEAILFRKAPVVSFLMENGADPGRKIEKPAKQAGQDGFQWADLVCTKSNDPCLELRDILDKSKFDVRFKTNAQPPAAKP